MIILKTIKENRWSFIVAFSSVGFYLSISFLPRLWPAFFSPDFDFLYFLSTLVVLMGISIFGLVSLIMIFRAGRRKKTASKIAITGAYFLLSYIMLTPITFAVHVYLPEALPAGSGARTFDSTFWKAKNATLWNDGISVREQMLKDVIENVLPEKNKKQIEDQLGPSLKTNYFSEINKDLIYYLGPERGSLFNIDSEWLLIWLDEKGRFEHYEIVND